MSSAVAARQMSSSVDSGRASSAGASTRALSGSVHNFTLSQSSTSLDHRCWWSSEAETGWCYLSSLSASSSDSFGGRLLGRRLGVDLGGLLRDGLFLRLGLDDLFRGLVGRGPGVGLLDVLDLGGLRRLGSSLFLRCSLLGAGLQGSPARARARSAPWGRCRPCAVPSLVMRGVAALTVGSTSGAISVNSSCTTVLVADDRQHAAAGVQVAALRERDQALGERDAGAWPWSRSS